MKNKVFKTLEKFNDDNSGTIEALVFILFLTLVLINLTK